jgi:hypothetical protein
VGWCVGGGWIDPLGGLDLSSSELTVGGAWQPADGPPQTLPSTALKM